MCVFGYFGRLVVANWPFVGPISPRIHRAFTWCAGVLAAAAIAVGLLVKARSKDLAKQGDAAMTSRNHIGSAFVDQISISRQSARDGV
jgi:hypothetical protein